MIWIDKDVHVWTCTWENEFCTLYKCDMQFLAAVFERVCSKSRPIMFAGGIRCKIGMKY